MTYIKKFCQCPTHATIFDIEKVEKRKIDSSENIVLFFYEDLEQAREYIFNNLCDSKDPLVNITNSITIQNTFIKGYRANVVERTYSSAIQDISYNVLRMRSNHIMLENPESRFMSLELEFINMGHKLFVALPKEENNDKDVSELVYSLWNSIPEDSYQKQLFFHYLGSFAAEHQDRNPYNSIKLGVEVFDQTTTGVESYFLTAPYAHWETK